jgi:aryl-alcohol dehydrogenase-like predicted oxidoreductase
VAWSPLAGGFLTGKYTRQNPGGNDGRLSTFRLQPIDADRGYGIVEALAQIGSAHGVTPAAIALAWAASRTLVSTVIFWATSMEGLVTNLGAVDLAPAKANWPRWTS